jgi:hypothetical protein
MNITVRTKGISVNLLNDVRSIAEVFGWFSPCFLS